MEQIRNSNFDNSAAGGRLLPGVVPEIRNKHEGSKSKIRNGAKPRTAFSSLEPLDFEFVSDFGLPRFARNDMFRISNFRPRAGFTLVEAVISTVIVSVMFVAALTTVGASRLTQHKGGLVGRGRLLAESLMSEILLQSYQELGETYVFGRESGESAAERATYDDVDDYHGWSESPPVAKDGTSLPNGANWRRTVAVEWVDPADPQQVSGTETGAKRILVTALHQGVPQALLVAIRTAY
jgi:type II secretory pathway pseudopilin PulG